MYFILHPKYPAFKQFYEHLIILVRFLRLFFNYSCKCKVRIQGGGRRCTSISSREHSLFPVFLQKLRIFLQIRGFGNGYDPFFDLGPRFHDQMSASTALKAYVCTDAENFPFPATAGVWLFHFHDIIDLNIQSISLILYYIESLPG